MSNRYWRCDRCQEFFSAPAVAHHVMTQDIVYAGFMDVNHSSRDAYDLHSVAEYDYCLECFQRIEQELKHVSPKAEAVTPQETPRWKVEASRNPTRLKDTDNGQ